MSDFAIMTVYIVTMCITPGPNCILSMVNAAQKGFPKCMSLNLGMFLGNFILDSIAYFLVKFLVAYMPLIQPVLQILGIIYILYLAFRMLKSGEIKVLKNSGDFKTGFVLQFMNIKVILLAVTVVSAYIIPMKMSFFSGYLVMPYLGLIALASTTTWALAGAALSKWYNRYRKFFNNFFALTLVALAVSNFVYFCKYIAH